MTDPFGPPQIPRDRFGRPLIVPPSGGRPVAYTRCTTFVGALEDRFNLGQWEQRMVATGLAKRPDLVLAAAAHSDDKTELNRICASAKDAAAGNAAATTGTALHKLTERLDRGQEVGEVPEAYRADLEAYWRAMRPFTVCEVERFCVLDSLRIGGTPDLIIEHEGTRYIADKKTGSLEYGALKIAMQLSVYARSQAYDFVDGEPVRAPLDVDTERAIVIHLPAGEGRAELKWVDIKTAWAAVLVAKDVREWRAAKGLIYPMDPIKVFEEGGFTVEPVTAADHGAALGGAGLHYEIERADEETLTALWTAHRSEWTDEHTRAAKARKTALHQERLRNAASAA